MADAENTRTPPKEAARTTDDTRKTEAARTPETEPIITDYASL
jgi:hypothetical protein